MLAVMIRPGNHKRRPSFPSKDRELLCLVLEKGERQKVSGRSGKGPEALSRSVLHVAGIKC